MFLRFLAFMRSFLATSVGETEASGELRIRQVIVNVDMELGRPQSCLWQCVAL